jgi:hypothetical protein
LSSFIWPGEYNLGTLWKDIFRPRSIPCDDTDVARNILDLCKSIRRPIWLLTFSWVVMWSHSLFRHSCHFSLFMSSIRTLRHFSIHESNTFIRYIR